MTVRDSLNQLTAAVGAVPQKSNQPLVQAVTATPGMVGDLTFGANRLANQLRAQYNTNWTIKGIDRAKELATYLDKRGVKSLANAKFETKELPATPEGYETVTRGEAGEVSEHRPAMAAETVKFMNFDGVKIGSSGNVHNSEPASSDIGFFRQNNDAFATSVRGKGAVSFKALNDEKGNLRIFPVWKSTSDAGKIRDILKVGVSLAIPGLGLGAMLGGGLGLSGLTASVVGNGLASAGTSALMGARGSNILKAGLGGAVGAGVGGSLAGAGFSPVVSRLGGQFAGGVASGRDLQTALLSSIIGAGTNAAAGATGASPAIQRLMRTLMQHTVQKKLPRRRP